jgi:hypothetical protein
MAMEIRDMKATFRSNAYRNAWRLVALGVLCCCASYASGEPLAEAFNCTLDTDFDEIDYELLGGDADQEYVVRAFSGGCAQITEAPPNLTGADDSADMSIACKAGCVGDGNVTLTFSKNGTEIARCTVGITCDGDGNFTLDPTPTVAACCIDQAVDSCEEVPESECLADGGRYHGDGSTCAEYFVNGTCIPAVSEWGLVAMMLLVLAAGTVVARRRAALTA